MAWHDAFFKESNFILKLYAQSNNNVNLLIQIGLQITIIRFHDVQKYYLFYPIFGFYFMAPPPPKMIPKSHLIIEQILIFRQIFIQTC